MLIIYISVSSKVQRVIYREVVQLVTLEVEATELRTLVQLLDASGNEVACYRRRDLLAWRWA